MFSTLLASVVLAQTVLGPDPSEDGRLDAGPSVRCDRCGAKVAAIASTIARLKTSRRDLVRLGAVIALRRYDWRCHPEIATALIDALRHDPDDAVRAEAAVSLAKLRVNLPEAIAALNQAASDDQLGVRVRAKWSLKVLAGRGPGKGSLANRIGLRLP